MDFFETFFAFLFAFIVKDFYDIFIQNHIKKWLSTYKNIVSKQNNVIKKHIKIRRKIFNWLKGSE